MRIAYVYDAIARIGGVERILTDKMNYLAEVYGYEVYLITAAQGMHPFSFPLSDKVKHTDINTRFHVLYQYGYLKRLWLKWKLNRQFKRNLTKAVRQIDPDIIIGTTYYKADVICKLKCRSKKVIESHCAKSYTGQNDGVLRNGFLQWICNRRLAGYNRTIERKSNAIVALTQGDAAEWEKKGHVFVIPNMVKGMPARKSTCEVRRVVSAGRLIYQKGYDLLIQAWSIVYKKHPDWRLDIFGEGPQHDELQRQIAENGLEEVITLHPFTSHILEEFLQSSIYVMSSRFEGFGLVLAEAMTCGLPCLSFDCMYGPSDIITHGEDGVLAEKDSVEQLAEGIRYLMENEDKRKEYGRKAEKNVRKFFPKSIMPQWDNLFKGIQ